MDFTYVEEILKYIGAITVILTFFWSLHKLYVHFLKPNRKISKYHKLYVMIEDWFDEIDKNLETGLNHAMLNNKENKIRQFIIDNKIAYDKLKFNRRFKKNI